MLKTVRTKRVNAFLPKEYAANCSSGANFTAEGQLREEFDSLGFSGRFVVEIPSDNYVLSVVSKITGLNVLTVDVEFVGPTVLIGISHVAGLRSYMVNELLVKTVVKFDGLHRGNLSQSERDRLSAQITEALDKAALPVTA